MIENDRELEMASDDGHHKQKRHCSMEVLSVVDTIESIICADGQGPCKSSHQYLCRASYLVRLRISRESDHVMFGCPSQRRHSKQPAGHFSALSSCSFSLGLKAMKNFAL